MLPRTKYNRFRNDSVTSVDDLLHNLSVSGGGKVSAARAAPAAAPYLVSGDALRRAPDDGPGSLGHLLHKVSHLKLSSSGLRGLSAARERAGARLSGSCSAPSLAAPDGSAPPGPRAPAMRAARKGRPGDEPPPRAPHANDQVLGAGVTYVVKYLGCIEVLRSMRSLDFSTRTQITRMQSLDEPWTEEEGDGSDHPYYNSVPSKTPPPGGFVDARLKARSHGPDTAQFAGKEQTYYQGRHLGDPFGEDWQQTPVRQGERQGSLDVYSVPEGKSHVTPVGEAPTYVNTQRIPLQPGPAAGSSAESSPRKDLFDMKPFEDALKNQSLGPVLSKAASVECISPVSPRAPDAKMLEELKAEPWYQGEMSRKEAEGLLKRDGDFLVRKSTTNPGSFVLTGMHNGQAKHLLLVDPEGTIRTKDRIFDSISHLIHHHLENSLPIVSAGSELCLQQPVERNP
uniref:SHC adaptor protein 3 n=1 Tax=Sus scrofa TaxID=9823 RepID=A0A8D1UNU1_PIG